VLVAGGRPGAPTAWAHDPFQITSEARVGRGQLVVRTTMSLLTAARACLPGQSALRIPRAADFEPARPLYEACARELYRVTSGGDPLPAREVRVELAGESEVEMVVSYARPTRSPLVFEAPHLRPLVARAGIVLTVMGERSLLGQQLLRPEQPRLEIPITADGEALGTPPLPTFRQYLALGIRHILTGYDHLLFLVGLLIVCRRFRTVAAIITCFTLAHSVTLALAALDVVKLPGRVVEPLIAATIVFVGVENVARGDEPRGRWALAFGFGLVHGLGFASALRDVGLGAFGTSIVAPLVAFNLGVELGQLTVAAVLLALLWRLRRFGWFARHGTRAVSWLVGALGLVWLVQRLGG
jgi:hydrogenase/urease accessory protein HupE